MERYFPSPFIMQECPILGYGLNLLPSIRRCSGVTFNCSIALCMARKEAFRMFILSISSGETIPIAQEIASFSMIERNAYRCFSESFLESFNASHLKFVGRITAAAYTAPARHPLPASSQPASILFGSI